MFWNSEFPKCSDFRHSFLRRTRISYKEVAVQMWLIFVKINQTLSHCYSRFCWCIVIYLDKNLQKTLAVNHCDLLTHESNIPTQDIQLVSSYMAFPRKRCGRTVWRRFNLIVFAIIILIRYTLWWTSRRLYFYSILSK